MEGLGVVDSGELEVVSLKREQLGGHHPPPRRTQRHRLLVTGGCALALFLAVSGLLLSTQPNPRAALGSLIDLPTETPTAALPLGASLFFVEHRVPWGVLSVDGKRNDAVDLTTVQPGSNSDAVVSFLLARGRHTVVYTAPPFSPLRCVVSVPAALADTCPLAQPDEQMRGQIVGVSRILDLSATVNHLPAQPMADLVAAATKAISISTPNVAASAGDHYLGPDVQTHTFTQDMKVSLFREPWQGAPVAPLSRCQFLCPGVQDPSLPTAAGSWRLTAEVREGYHYVPVAAGAAPLADGALVWTTLGGAPSQGSLIQSVSLDVTWDGTWQVKIEASDRSAGQALVCQAASAVVGNYGGADSGPAATVPRPGPMVPAANQANGCAQSIQMMNPDGTKGATGTILYRFGVVLATDAASHSLFPQAPQADAAEQALAQQILAQAP